jgi:hypothetical protein
MATPEEREINQAAYRRLKGTIDKTFPPGRFVAILGGQVVADGASVLEVCSLLRGAGKDPRQSLVVEAGVNYPDYVTILGVREAR